MALTNEAISALKAKVEPREAGVVTETGLLKLANGTLLARPSTRSGARNPAELEQEIADDESRVAQLQALRAQQAAQQPVQEPAAKRTRRRKVDPEPAQQPTLKQITVTVLGFGGIPSQYAHVNIGEGVALLGVSSMSFIPQQSDTSQDPPTNMLELSTAPGKKYIYIGNTVVDDSGVKNLVLIEVPEGE